MLYLNNIGKIKKKKQEDWPEVYGARVITNFFNVEIYLVFNI